MAGGRAGYLHGVCVTTCWQLAPALGLSLQLATFHDLPPAPGFSHVPQHLWRLPVSPARSCPPAGHTSLISQVRFEPTDGQYLLTAGYDNTSRLWGGPKFRLLRTLAGHEGKVMGADVSPDGSFTVATTGYDRTIKLYAPDLLADLGEDGDDAA